MSGGSFGYAFHHVEAMAIELLNSPVDYRRAFAEHLLKVSQAMRSVEWSISGDTGPDDDKVEVMHCIQKEAVIAELLKAALELKSSLIDILKDWDVKND